MKKYTLIIFLSLIVLIFTGCTSKTAGLYKDGIYAGEGDGKYGLIKVEVLIEDEKITEIKTIEHKETPGLSDPVFDQMYDSIIEAQNTEVDTVSGATVTGDGIKSAVTNALEKAK